MDKGTLLQRRSKKVKFSKEEILLILRAYREHPSRWSDVLEDIRQNLELLPQPARDLYRQGSEKKIKERMSVKLGKLMTMHERIDDADIRREIELVRQQERRFVAPHPAGGHQPVAAPEVQAVAARQNQVEPVLAPNIEPNIAPQVEPNEAPQVEQIAEPQPQQLPEPQVNIEDRVDRPERQPIVGDRRDAIAANLPDLADEPPARRRRLSDLVRENHELYNRFMVHTMPRILEQFGVNLDD